MQIDNKTFRCSLGAAVFAAALFASVVLTSAANAQTVIYDGSQQLNFYTGTDLTGPLMLNNTPGDDTRNGIVQSGADPNALERDDAAWFRSTGRRMRNTNLGAAGSATGVDGDFMSSLFDASGATTSGSDANAAGASYVLYDDGATTGPQILNFSLYYNDATPNLADGTNNGDGGIVAVRVQGVQGTGDATDPWGTDAFRHLASSGGAAAGISAGQHRDNSGEEAGPQVDNLLNENSNAGEGLLTSSADWQDISIPFDLGAGYEYIIFSFAGAAQVSDPQVLGADRFGFDNISFEAASTTIEGDYDDSGQVAQGDLDLVLGIWGQTVPPLPATWVNAQPADGTQIGQTELDGVLLNWGNSAVASVAGNVPEPSAVLLLVIGMSLVSQTHNQRRY